MGSRNTAFLARAGSWGGWVDRDFGPLRTGGEINNNGNNQYEARFRIGFVF